MLVAVYTSNIDELVILDITGHHTVQLYTVKHYTLYMYGIVFQCLVWLGKYQCSNYPISCDDC